MRTVLRFRGGAVTETAADGARRPRKVVGGTVLDLLVLTADSRGCVGVDLESGAFVRACYGGTGHPSLRDVRPIEPFDVVAARIAREPEQVPDVSRPETVMLDAPPMRVRQMPPRKAERFLSPLQQPRRLPILGFTGRCVPYWTLSGDRPSVTLLEVTNAQLRWNNDGFECRFTWQGARHQYPLGDRRLATELAKVGWPRYAAHDLHNYLGYRVRRLLIVLSPPHEGYCYKLVAALLPGP